MHALFQHSLIVCRKFVSQQSELCVFSALTSVGALFYLRRSLYEDDVKIYKLLSNTSKKSIFDLEKNINYIGGIIMKKINKIVSIILAIIMVIFTTTITPSAETSSDWSYSVISETAKTAQIT